MTAIAGPSPARQYPSPRIGANGGFWAVAFAFAVTMAFSTLPTPLYVLYQQRIGFDRFMVTVVFAAYAVGVVVSLLLTGHLSDQIGRRRILLPALLIEAAAALVFLLAPTLAGLLAARLLSGVGIGMILSTATAYLTELHRLARPHAGGGRADLLATVANMGGIGLGPLVSGLLAQYVPGPLRTPYQLFLVLLLGAAAAVALAPETVPASGARTSYRPRRLGAVPAAGRQRYAAAAAAGFTSFAVLGLFTSLAPTFVADVLDDRSRAVAGTVAFTVFAAGAATQLLLGRSPARSQLAAGLGLLASGLVGVSAAAWWPSLAGFLAAGAVTGAGAGLLFKGAVATVAELAEPGARGAAMAGLFLAAYAGLTVPVLALGIATQVIAVPLALIGFALVALLAVGGLGRRLLLHHPTATAS